jgi:fucose permease
MVFLLLLFNEGFGFAAILACLGIFLYSINPIMLATALDATPIGAEASTTAMMFTGPAIFGALSPIIAGYIRETYGMNAVFTYIGIIVAFVALCSLIVPIRKTN